MELLLVFCMRRNIFSSHAENWSVPFVLEMRCSDWPTEDGTMATTELRDLNKPFYILKWSGINFLNFLWKIFNRFDIL